ncbi:MAG: response regulator [Deltaproteobacteria bacterium]|nr:response regulator [Deltaproteobacteria bacterium]
MAGETSKREASKKDVLEFQKHIKKRNILIVDTSPTTRAMLGKSFSDLGARGDFIHSATSFLEAQDQIARLCPQIVVTDFNLGAQSGLLLINLQRESNPNAKDTLFIIITGNTSQTAIAQAAEEEVDSYIIKPFTLKGLRSSLVKAVMSKVHPSDYVKAIEEGKKALFKGDLDTAEIRFDEALALNPKPSLAYFYKGQLGWMRKALGSAEEDFRHGLEFNKIHYKCLVGLFDLLMSQGRDAEAYVVVRKIATYFPSNPKRLYQILRLTVALREFEDLLDYYEAFCNLPARENELTLQMCAAVTVAGKHFFERQDRLRGLDFLRKAAVSSGALPNILKEIVLILAAHGEIEEAETVLKRFSADDRDTGAFAACDLAVRAKIEPARSVATAGLKYLEKKMHDPLVFEITIQKLIENGSKTQADNLLFEAKKAYPEYKFLF